MTRNTTPILLNLSSDVDEPGISNDEFLDSLASIGVWLRVLSAYDSFERYTSHDSTSPQRLAALSNIYLQLGAQLEDQAVSLVAFSVWSKNRDLVLADLFSRIFVKRPRTTTSETEIQRVQEKLENGSKTHVFVDLRAFFPEVVKMSDSNIVKFFLGYWRTVPSVKLIPKDHHKVWKDFPGELRRIAALLYDERHGGLLNTAYNKLKHGPQLVIQNPVDRAKLYAQSPDIIAEPERRRKFDKASLRLLFAGAKTQGEPTDQKLRRVAPFLINDEGTVKKLFFETMVYHAYFFRNLVRMQIALYRKKQVKLNDLDPGIEEIVRQANLQANM